MSGIIVQARRVRLEQGSHLVDKGSRASRAYSIHALVDAAGEVDDLGVLAAQLDGHIGLGRVVLKRGGHGHHLLDEGNLQMMGERQSAGTGDHGDNLHGPGLFPGFSQKFR